MKIVLRRLGLPVLLLAFLLVPARSASAQIGLAAGLNYDSISDISINNVGYTFDNATGWHVGIFYDLKLGLIAIRPGVFYRKGGKVPVSLSSAVDELTTIDVDYIEIPIDVRIRLALPIVKPYVLVGPVFNRGTSSDTETEANLKEWSYSGAVGVGVEISLLGIGIIPELRYQFGISSIFNDEVNIEGITLSPNENVTQNSIMLRVGLDF